MPAEDIIMSMVNGLINPAIKVDMDSFGYSKHGICFGCAATNAVCHISGKVYNSISIANKRAEFLGTDTDFLNDFECAIDFLRSGNLSAYNLLAAAIGVKTIEDWDIDLPWLGNDYTQEDLQAYINLANYQTQSDE